MFGILFWFFIIFIIWSATVKKKGASGTSSKGTNADKYRDVRSHYDDPGMRKMQAEQNNSYYSKQKVESYNRMERAHQDHAREEDYDLAESIGYVKCPKCGGTVSKKSEVCFLCDEPLKK